MNPLASRYLGLDLAHPIIASASPLTATFDAMRRLEDAGAAAVVVASLDEEEIRAAHAGYAMLTEESAGCHPEAASYFPEVPDDQYGRCGHLELVQRAAEALDIPVIAGLNGVSDEGWPDFAVQLELAGAAALELNLYLLPTDFALSGSDIERHYVDIVRHVKRTVRIPVSVTLPPFFSTLGNFAKQLESAGADGLVFFNPLFRLDLDIDTQTVTAEPALSSPIEIHVPLTWIALLSPRLELSLAAAGGVDSYVEVVKFLLAGMPSILCQRSVVISTEQVPSPSMRYSAGNTLARWVSTGFPRSKITPYGRLTSHGSGLSPAITAPRCRPRHH
jgi:dihydroorotate dehydrogenase (fumarate)